MRDDEKLEGKPRMLADRGTVAMVVTIILFILGSLLYFWLFIWESSDERAEREALEEQEAIESERMQKEIDRQKYIHSVQDDFVENGVELDISTAIATDNTVYVDGTTTLVDGAILVYDINGYEGTTTVHDDGKWLIEISQDVLQEQSTYADGQPENYSFWLAFMPLNAERDSEFRSMNDDSSLVQPEIIYDIYGEGALHLEPTGIVQEYDGTHRIIIEANIKNNN